MPHYNAKDGMNSKVLIIGNHPINADLTNQFHLRDDSVVWREEYSGFYETDVAAFDELVILADINKESMEADNEAMSALRQIAAAYCPEQHDGKRLLCHLLLRSQSLLYMINLEGLCQDIDQRLEVVPFTIEEQWSRAIALRLDRAPITLQSDKTVHLVIFGMSSMAEQVAIQAAHVCHFPNYTRNDHSLRTRITVIDEQAADKRQEWIQKYKHLFDNSHYRFVDTRQRPAVTDSFVPMYKDRSDFVDVEWEFVAGTPYDSLVRKKISQWSASPAQLLTIVFADSHSEMQLSNVQYLPEEVAKNKIPVYVYMQHDEAYQQIQHTGSTSHLIPFGMVNRGYDVNVPLLKMAKNVKYIYDCCYQDNVMEWDGHLRFSVSIDEKKKEQAWQTESAVKRTSNIYNAMTIGVKMRSMGFKEDDWEKFYDLSQEEIELLAEVEHNRWSVEELILGWRPCTDDEQQEIAESIEAHIEKRNRLGDEAVKNEKTLKEIYKTERKAHYDLRTYSDLQPDGTGRPVQVYDRCLSACIPLIAKESKGGGL